ncbi:unnamed protein product [Rotaria magnacalcarata]|uniref:Uncharacterized protein n=1 Tax=Rotaria magnacalcarata TaxID=392030 RepID=A0A816XDV6_9BILA|nr:unnamed protein product [Rotaria magnacalcarata]CAF2145751.1 unnamed protein product [Rotaria magnacalcarata]CAF4114573.1 unnamed protein product [Rotaria magnacalcarata]CAF4297062.1 unnamed protein product [Rotaria magnacalcarata]
MKLNIGLIFCGIILCCTYSISFSDPIETEDEFMASLTGSQRRLLNNLEQVVLSSVIDATTNGMRGGSSVNNTLVEKVKTLQGSLTPLQGRFLGSVFKSIGGFFNKVVGGTVNKVVGGTVNKIFGGSMGRFVGGFIGGQVCSNVCTRVIGRR